MKYAKSLLILVTVLTQSLYSQNLSQWRNYSSLKNITSVASDGTSVWAAGSGGAFKFTSADSSFEIFTKANGLSSQQLTTIAVDSKKNTWFGSAEGFINVLDTQNYNVSSIIDIFKSSITLKEINSIYIKGDTIFASIDFGLSLINAASLSFIDTFLKLGSFPSQTRVLSAYKTNLVYAITDQGIAVQKAGTTNLSSPDSWDNYYYNSNINATSSTKILSFNGQILLASSNGIYQFINSSWKQVTLSGFSVKDMIVSGNSIYAITDTALYQYSNTQVTRLYSNSSAIFNSITAIGTQAIYIGTDKGIAEYKNGKARLLTPNGPTSNSFLNLATDLKSNLWVATGKDVGGVGFFKFDGNTWKIYDTSNTPILPSNAYHNVFAAQDSTVYFSNWGKGIAVVKNDVVRDTITINNSPLVGYIGNTKFLSIADCQTDSRGNLWIANSQSASSKQLSCYTKDKLWKQYNIMGLSPNDYIGSMTIDLNDTKWFTIISGSVGLYYFNENKTFDIAADDSVGSGLLGTEISALAVDKHGYLWIGTGNGVKVITNTQAKRLTSNLGYTVVGQAINCIAVDPIDQKWIGTKQGIFVLSSDGIYPVAQYNTKNSPLPSDDIKSIVCDPKTGTVYIGTDYGLSVLQTSFIEPQQSFTKLFVYPNPLVIGKNNSASLSIDGLIKNSLIKVVSISGKLIREIVSSGGRISFWDGRDTNGNLVASGVYIIIAYDADANNVTTAKVAVLRN